MRNEYLPQNLFSKCLSLLALSRFDLSSFSNDRKARLLFFLCIFLGFIISTTLYAADYSSEYQISYENDLLTVSAREADLKKLVTELANKTGFSPIFPESLEKKITIDIKGLSLADTLQRILKGLNYTIFYSSSKNNQAAITGVNIIKQNERTPRQNRNSTRITSRIKTYERRIENIKKRLARVDENSSRGRSYLRQINSYEKTIENLRKQLY